ncbi:hypothetical protein B0H19DRAFT_448518 [Mycena capillaripes]|nr:hypothetical protein B0H19DRAFT_448518 [Mycena capillaripes]
MERLYIGPAHHLAVCGRNLLFKPRACATRLRAEIYWRHGRNLDALCISQSFANRQPGLSLISIALTDRYKVEAGLTSGHPDVNAIIQAVMIQVASGIITTIIFWAKEWTRPMLQTRIRHHFEEYIMRSLPAHFHSTAPKRQLSSRATTA